MMAQFGVQPRANGRAGLKRRCFEVLDRLIPIGRIRPAGGCTLQTFGGLCNPPNPDTSRRTHQGMGGRSSQSRFPVGDPFNHDRGLADENLEDFPLQPAVAKGHPAEMDFIQNGTFRL